ncbi:hypothetical protein HELRODRAFT_193269 [Helobdella robusta]|uniref:Fibronectin type-III domain-containing protein n=1 Tax=Helobdella robusta TaxID=6412 RepID=T1FUT5_HELRO|nr:hypothetical protein HELRODRAFT_193269 [Helobdella robusta]ESN97389.1 hypothetical protein HELRODRAFT_193269 [Helobdella robusta]
MKQSGSDSDSDSGLSKNSNFVSSPSKNSNSDFDSDTVFRNNCAANAKIIQCVVMINYTVYVKTFFGLIDSTDTPPPMSSPIALKSSASSSSSIQLSWSDISFKRLQKIKGTTDGRVYVVRFKSRLQGGYKYLNTTKLETVVQNLRPDTEYIFSVKVIIGKRQSSWSLNVVEKTKESAPTSAPTQLHLARNKDPTKVTLSWQPPTNPNGRITGYLVLYSEDVTLQDEHWKTKRVVGHTFSSTVDRLSANTKYYFKIQAVNAVGVGPVSLTALFKTTSDKIDGEKNTPLNHTLHQEERSNVESSKEWSLLPMLMTIISLVLVLVIIVSIFVIIKVKRNKIVIQNKEISDNPTSPDPSSGKSYLKPPDLWTHGEGNIREVNGNIDDFVNDHSSDDSSTAERWTLKSNHYLTEESKFKSLTLKQKTCTLMSNSSNVIPENDIQLSPALPSNSLLKSKYDFSKSHLSGPRVYVGDVANSTIDSSGPQRFLGKPSHYGKVPTTNSKFVSGINSKHELSERNVAFFDIQIPFTSEKIEAVDLFHLFIINDYGTDRGGQTYVSSLTRLVSLVRDP